jgi:hypothetical protein
MQIIMVMPKLFCEPLRVVCGVKTLHLRLVCALRFGQFLQVEAPTAGCKGGLIHVYASLVNLFNNSIVHVLNKICTLVKVIQQKGKSPG